MKSDFSKKLLHWHKHQNDRKMPWKGERDPYKIWLSEIILQQTRVEQGWQYYERFIQTFPTIIDLAKAPDEKVYKLWEGLGYYSRCKNLLETARVIASNYNGIFPSEYEEIRNLKGIGPYTAAAIVSFAFDKPYAVVDGNVQRILARYFGLTTPTDTGAGKKLYQQLADALLNQKLPALYNQAIMDFGATICKPQNPLCNDCIQRPECVAFAIDQVKALPVKTKMLSKKERWFYYYLVVINKRVYITKRSANDIWENLYEFLLEESANGTLPDFAKSPFLKKVFEKQAFSIVSVSKQFRQQLSHQTINGQFIVVNTNKLPRLMHHFTPVEQGKLSQFAFPGLINKFLVSHPKLMNF